MLLDPTPAAAQTWRRSAVAAALEDLIAGRTHVDSSKYAEHDEGQRLQWAVEAAFERGDSTLIRLAQRAASPLIAYASIPVATAADRSSVVVQAVSALKLPSPVPYSAEIFYSADGGPLIRAGLVESDGAAGRLELANMPLAPGFHQISIGARITYRGGDLPEETRALPDVFYAVYDREGRARPDIAAFVLAPAMMTAQQFDPNLPDVPLTRWLNSLARESGHEILWRSVHCPRGPRQLEFPPTTGDICVQGYLAYGLLWMKTGRIELTGEGVRWIPQVPELLSIQIVAPVPTEVYTFSELPPLLQSEPSTWPWWDVSILPEDIHVMRTGLGNAAMLDVTVTIRNQGRVDARGLLVTMLTSNGGHIHFFYVDVPRRGQLTLRYSEPMPWPYGAVIMNAVGSNGESGAWSRDDPTPDNDRAFRLVNPALAPEGYVPFIQMHTGPIRGY